MTAPTQENLLPDLRKWTRVSVFGGREADPEILDQARRFGQLAARENWVILNGGKNGVMEAVSHGVFENGGLCIGILPGEDMSEANPYLQIALPSGVGLARNEILARAADICIAIGGHYGTLSEIGHALSMDKKVISLHSWDIPGVISAETAEVAVRIMREILQ